MDRAVRMHLRRHPFLRTSVNLDGPEPVQLVHAEMPDVLAVVDLRGSDPVDRTHEFDRWLAAEPESRFDWSAPPLLRLTVHRFTDTEFRLTLTEPFLDGWSVTLALSELLDFYRALLAGQAPEAVAVRAQASFLHLERAALADDSTRDYWKAVLADPPGGGLPRGRHPVGRQVRAVPVPAATSRRLRRLADQLTVSVKSVLLAAHVQVVALLAGRTEVLTGLIANARPETEHGVRAVGMFLNTIPLRLDVDTHSARDLVAAVHAAEAGSLRHRSYPYAQMLRDSGLAQPLETVFNYTHFHPYRRFVDDGPPRMLAVDATDQTYHRLTAQFRQDVISGEVGLNLEFADREFDEDQIDRIAGYYAAALEQLAEAPGRPVTPLDRLLSAAERAGLEPVASTPAGTGQPAAPGPVDLYTMFARQARRTPDADALRYGAARVSYARLDACAAELAGRLTKLGAGPGDVVAVHLDRSPGYVAAVLGVLRTGAAYLPIDPRHPAERVARILAAGGARVVLTGAGHAARLPDDTARLLVDEIPEPATDRTPDRTVPAVAPAAPAVVVFTSGSTGEPKGVVLAHSAIVNRLAWSLSAEPDEPDEVFLLRTPVGFVDAVAELFDGLVRGAPTVILPDPAGSPDELVSTVADHQVSRVTLVPTLLGEMLRLDRDLTRDLAPVRQWHLSGEPLRGELVRALRAHQPKAVIRNLYGTTEVCADATVHTCADDDSAVVPAGTELPGVTAVVVHSDGGLAPFGTPGELAVGGRALAIGYLGDTRATARRFVPSAYGCGERLYRTGDLAVRRADGVLELLGRADRQIKVRGVRVEQAEVEANLVAHPDVDEAVVVQRAHRGRPALVGYVRATGHPESLGPALRAYLRDRLPNAAVPEVFVPVPAWPRLPSGKVDVATLPDPAAAPAASRPGRTPRSPLETELAALWQRELGSAPTDVDHDFWDLGGHSLSAIVLARSIERHTGVPFSVVDLYANSTLSAQVRLIEHLRASR